MPWAGFARQVVPVLAVLAAAGGAMAGTAPTGTAWWDAVLAGALAGMVALCGSIAPRAVVVVVAMVATALVGVNVWLIPSLAGLLVSVAATPLERRDRVLGALASGLSVQGLLRLPPLLFFGFPSIVVGVLVVVLLASAYRKGRRNTRRVMRIAAAVTALAVVATAVVGVLLLASVRQSATRGIGAAERGLAAARAGQTQALISELELAESQLVAAEESLNGPLALPLRLIPIAAQNHRALTSAARVGADTAASALASASAGDIEELRFRAGQFDLDQLQRLAPTLRETAASITAASEALEADRSPWLLPQLEDRLDALGERIDAAEPQAEVAALAAEVLPALLGGEAPRNYLVLAGTPGETRELGGFAGSYVLLEVAQGRFSPVASGRIIDLYSTARAGVLDDPEGYPTRFLQADPRQWPQNLTSSPSIQLVARATRDLMPVIEGRPIDGVAYVDALAIAQLLELTGPISVDGVDGPLTSQTFAEFALIEQYRRDTRRGLIDALALTAFEALASAELPGPDELGRVLGPVARQGRLQLVTFDDAENEFLQRIELQRVFGWNGANDAVAVVQTNASENKLDLYLRRSVRYEAAIEPTGLLRAVVEVDLTLDVPPDAPLYTLGADNDEVRNVAGRNEVLLSVYSPHAVVAYSVDGVSRDVASEPEFGYLRHFGLPVAVEAGQTVRLRYVLEGVAPPGEYALDVWYQPTVNDDRLTVVVNDEAGNPITSDVELTEDLRFVLQG